MCATAATFFAKHKYTLSVAKTVKDIPPVDLRFIWRREAAFKDLHLEIIFAGFNTPCLPLFV